MSVQTIATVDGLGALLQPPPDLTDWQVSLGGLVLGDGTPYVVQITAGLDELPGMRSQDEPRPWSHGSWVAEDWAEGRTIGMSIAVRGAAGVDLDDALDALRRVMVPSAGQDLVPLWVRTARRGLLCWSVRVRRWRIDTDAMWRRGVAATAEAQLYAPDPRGYGPGAQVAAGFAAPGGGLEFDLFTDDAGTDTGFLEFGAAGSSGRIELANTGTAESWPVHRIDGPTPAGGFDIADVGSGRRLRFVGVVPAGSHLAIDTATGSVILDDVADRSRQLVRREWTPIPPGGSATLAFLALSTPTAAVLSVSFASAWW